MVVFQAKAESANKKYMELTHVSTQIKQLQKNLVTDRQLQENLQHELATTETTISQLNLQARALNLAILKEEKQLSHLREKQQILLSKLAEQQQALNLQLRTAYQLKNIDSLKILLNQNNPNTIQRHLTYHRYLTQSHMQLIAKATHSLSSLNSTMQDITQHQTNLKKFLNQKQTQQADVQKAKKHRQQLLTHSTQSVETKEQQLNALLANQKALHEIISQLRTQTENNPPPLPFHKLHGKLQWPVKGVLTAKYGSAINIGEPPLNGVIIETEQDTPVHAVASGKVIFATWLRGFGLLIIINHDNNFMSLYGRNNTVMTHVGAHVHTGDVIATAGNSGGFDKASLYFEIRQNGTPINPNMWCS
jgi:septal ring factor EnvC (AmiA/AmiB activator)